MVAGMEALCQVVRKTLFHGMPSQHGKASCGEGFAWVSRLFPGGETALSMWGSGPSHVGFPNQDANQDTAPPQPFQPSVKRLWA